MRTRHSERGATAIMVAILAVVLFGIGAVAVDMGQAYAQRRDLQTNVDLAVMAAVAELDGSKADKGYADARTAAEDYLIENEVFGQITLDLDGAPGDDDGYLELPADGNEWKIRLYAPKVAIDLGLANAFEGSFDVKVPAKAAAEVKSPGGSGTLPMYAVGGGCDYGSETISDAPAGPADPFVVPPLTPSTSPTFNAAEFTITPTEAASGSTTPFPMTLDGTNLANVVEVGFTTAAGDHYVVDADGDGNDFTINGPGTSIAVDSVPTEVLALEDFWFVRVKTADGNWSDTADAQLFTVGDRLYCSGSVSGNYGSLRIPRGDGTPTGKILATNIIKGVDPVLEIHPSPPADNDCKGDASPTVESGWPSSPVDGTNCLSTEPGFPTDALTDGLVDGWGSYDGRLDKDTTPGCGRSGDDRTAATPSGVELNDDLLTCYFTNLSTPISQVVSGAAENVISADILNSPRFFWIPVVPVEPAMGSCCAYPIIDRRPGFITDQPITATKGSPSTGSMSTHAGVMFDGFNKVRALKVVLFDEDALPDTAAPTGDEVAYTGSGIKVLTLVE